MDTSRYIQSCNPGRFLITSSLLIFSILFALKLDGYIQITYWLVFLPIFIWKILVIVGGCTGLLVWCKTDHSNRNVRTPDNDCRAMIFYFFLHIFIFTFELLVCGKLENHLDIRWIICFIPLLFCTILSLISCLWSMKTQRNFLIQTFISLNGLFFLFLPLRLDHVLIWRYSIIFTPVWISLCFSLLFILSKLIFGIVHRCSHRLLANQREINTIEEALIYAGMFIPLGIFSVLLVERLDYEETNQTKQLSFVVIAIPLWISLIAWLLFSFGAKDSNPWWFGFRRDLCEILLDRYPCVSLYFNNRFQFATQSTATARGRNDLVVDLSSEKNLELLNPKHSSDIIDTQNDKSPVKQHQFMSLLVPD